VIGAARVLATEIQIGDRVQLIGSIWFTVEWMRVSAEGAVSLAGVRCTGEPHINQLSAHAKVTRLS
jgi:hypothetical protein